MPAIIINLTIEEEAAFVEMLEERTIEQYLKTIALNYNSQKLDNEWKEKTKEEKEALLSDKQ